MHQCAFASACAWRRSPSSLSRGTLGSFWPLLVRMFHYKRRAGKVRSDSCLILCVQGDTASSISHEDGSRLPRDGARRLTVLVVILSEVGTSYLQPVDLQLQSHVTPVCWKVRYPHDSGRFGLSHRTALSGLWSSSVAPYHLSWNCAFFDWDVTIRLGMSLVDETRKPDLCLSISRKRP